MSAFLSRSSRSSSEGRWLCWWWRRFLVELDKHEARGGGEVKVGEVGVLFHQGVALDGSYWRRMKALAAVAMVLGEKKSLKGDREGRTDIEGNERREINLAALYLEANFHHPFSANPNPSIYPLKVGPLHPFISTPRVNLQSKHPSLFWLQINSWCLG